MSKIGPLMLGLSLAFAGSSMAAAQDAASSTAPVILQITREFTKPYKGGAAHDKTESAFIAAEKKANFPAYYVAMNAMTGKSRALFMTRYSSFAEWEKDNNIVNSDPTLGAELERAGIADGELLDSVDSEVFTLNRELSYHSHNDLAHHHFYQIMVFHVKPGHHKDWVEVVNMVKAAHDKMGDNAPWGMYEVAFGTADGTYLAITGDPTMAVIDDAFADNKKFVEAIGGEEGMAKLDELFGAAVDSSHSELFAVNPKQSYVGEDWVKADPDFWKPKAAMPAAKPAADEKKSK